MVLTLRVKFNIKTCIKDMAILWARECRESRDILRFHVHVIAYNLVFELASLYFDFLMVNCI